MGDYPGLAFSEDGNRLRASVSAIADPPQIDVEKLRSLLSDAGYSRWQLAEEALGKLVECYNSATETLDLPIGERRDSVFSLEIAPDAMQVWLKITPAFGGSATDASAVFIALGEAGVTTGIDEEAIRSACAASSGGADQRVLIASGTPAVNGEDAKFELLVADARDRAPQVNEHGLIDFRDLGAIPTVAADHPLMRRTPATPGTTGRNVRGDVIQPTPGHDESFADNLTGAYVDKADPNLLRATNSGQPVRCGNGVNVEEVLRIRNVNMATGNISFDGTVHIEGEVLPGMKVRAAGDIIVGDVVDGAELDAGGDIRIGGGVIAKAIVRAGGSVAVRFVENATVHAGTTIAVDDTALQSDLQANNQILVGVNSPQRGRLAGGSARAMLLIRTPILGSPTSGVTHLLLGVNPVLEAEYQELLKKIQKQREDEDNLEKLVKHLTKNGDKGGLLERAKASWQQAIKAWAKLLPQREELERQLALIAGAKVEIGVGVTGAVDVTFGKKVIRVRKPYESGTLSMDGERGIFTDLMGNTSTAA